MENLAGSDPERAYRRKQSAWRIVALVIALLMAFGSGMVAGGGLLYGVMKITDLLPAARVQRADADTGIVIASVVADSPAAAAGLVRGDILLKVDGVAVGDSSELVRRLGDFAPGEVVELSVLHGDDLRTLRATLQERDGLAFLGVVPCGGLPMQRQIETPFQARGALVIEVMPDSPAEEAGVRAGDLILAVEGQQPSSQKSLSDLIASYKPGDTVTLQIERPGAVSLEVEVKLGRHPEDPEVAYLGVRYSSAPRSGGWRLPFGRSEEFGFDGLPFRLPGGELRRGVVVRSVTKGSPASDAGLEVGDVITNVDGAPVATPQDLVEAITGHEPGDHVTLSVYRSGGQEEREVKVILGEDPEEAGKAYLGVSIAGYLEQRRLEGREGSPGFRSFEAPFGLPLDELPFNPDWLPFNLDELPFDWHSLPFDPGQFPFDWHDLQPEGARDQSA